MSRPKSPPLSRPKIVPPPPRRHEGSTWELGIYGELTEKQLELSDRLTEVPAGSRGLIWFDSCGGSVSVGLALASLIRLRGLKVIGVVAGECSSAAILPFAACDRRLITEHSTLLFHPVKWQSDENVRVEEAVEWARQFQALEEDLDALLAKLMGMSEELLEQWTRPGRFVRGEELVEAGLAEKIDLFSGSVWDQLK